MYEKFVDTSLDYMWYFCDTYACTSVEILWYPYMGKLVVGRSDAPEEVKQREAKESNNRQKE